MKFSYLLLFVSLFLSSFLISQTEDWGPSKAMLWEHELMNSDAIDSRVMPSFDVAQVLYEDSINDHNKIGPWRFGYSFNVDYNLSNSGTWETLPGHGKIWRLKLSSDGALTMNFLFADMHIPSHGGYISIYNPSNDRRILTYTDQNNLDHKKLGTELTYGEEVIIEVFEPTQEEGNASLTITNVIHGYRSLDVYAQSMMRALNSSGDCNIDILCPEGNGWELQAKSVAMIVVNGSGACSGALVNNTQNDGTPYFLTANHCGTDPTNWAFRFNWDSPNPSCATTTPSTDGPTNMQTANGGIFRAANAGSDFFLLEISNPPLASWDIYYSGWDRSDIVPDSVIGIHHPAGDVKKICKYYAQPIQTTFNAGGGNAECWEIPDWTMGVTEGGSSGSPLFDHNHRIIGQLYGGTAACSNSPTTEDNGEPDYYGRFGISWDGASSAERLKDWLDPTATDTNYIDGYYPLTITDDYDAFAIVVQNMPLDFCGTSSATPSLYLRNNGLQTLTSMNIKVDINGSITTIPWTGNLMSGDYETVPLGTINFTDGLDQVIKVYTETPNGQTDQNMVNDTITSIIDVQTLGEYVTFDIVTDCNGSENAIYIENSVGVNVFDLVIQGSLSDGFFGSEINRDVCLTEDCYELVITDTGGDGWPDDWLCFATYGVNVTYNSNSLVSENTFTFTNSVSYPFCTGTASIKEFNLANFKIYPNPTKNQITLEFDDQNEGFKVQVLDLSGRLLIEKRDIHTIDLSQLAQGTYLIKLIKNNGQSITKKVIKD